MKINFTKKQYEKLIRLLFLGEFVLNGHKEETDEDYDDILQYIYSFSKEMGQENLIEYDSSYDKYFETREFEDEMFDSMEKYDENTFFDSFVDKTAAIAFRRKYESKQDQMGVDAIMGKIEELRARTEEYLDDVGLEKAIEPLLKYLEAEK